ncbi:uncharacterized protein [Hetaerina americana]|uniref:uncharacterized protein n=1 Tax=Hetaerina americana TaxID=62018 RepID=UPI003A7F580D
MAMEGGPYLVQAIFSFKGKNNDELCFRKGDVITITQMEEGGWWEGTLEGKTGWFPANYVQEYKQQVPLPQGDVPHLPGAKGGASPISPGSPMQGVAAQRAYRHVVLADMVESERVHVTELNTLLNSYLNPLQKSQLLTAEEYAHLVGNLPVVLDAHEQLLCGLEAELSVEESQEPGAPSRVGRLFLSSAQLLKTVHANYCAGHPRAVCLLEKYRDELGVYMESRGATPPGLLVLTTGLSRPFRRLDKYAGMLQELERHLGEGHPDSGDTQRSVSIYGEVASGCCALRRQKELELEVLRGGIRGWEGEDLHTLGEILHMGSVAVGPDHRDRHLLLFPSTLLILSASQRMSAFIYEGKLPLSGISVTKLEDTDICKNAFEIAGPMIEHIVAQCQSKEDQAKWVSLLNHHINIFCKISMTSGSGVSSPSTAPVLGSPPPLPPTTTSPTGSTKSQKVSSSSVGVSNSTQAAKHVSSMKPPVPPRPFPPPKQTKCPDGTRPPRPPLPPKPTLSINLSLLKSPLSFHVKPSHHSDPHLHGCRVVSQFSDAGSSSHVSTASLSELEFTKNDTSHPQGSKLPNANAKAGSAVASSPTLSSGNDLAKFKDSCQRGGLNVIGESLIRSSAALSRSVSTLSSSELPSLLDFPDTSSNSSLFIPIENLETCAEEMTPRSAPPEALGNASYALPLGESGIAATSHPKESATALDPPYRPPRPYSQLAAHFADLLQRHIITSKMLKGLLYKEYGSVGGLEMVALRVRPSEIQPAEDDEEMREMKGNADDEAVMKKVFLPRQDAVDRASEDPNASVYSGDEFVRYFEGNDVEEEYLESGEDSETDEEESFVEVWIEEDADGWRTIGTQTNPSYFASFLDDLEEEEYEEQEYEEPIEGDENIVQGEVYGSQEIEVKDENSGDAPCHNLSSTNSDGWTYQDYQGDVGKLNVIPACSMAGLSSPLLDLREAGVSALRDAGHSVSKRFGTGRRRRFAEDVKRHSIPTSLLPCLSRETRGEKVHFGTIDEGESDNRGLGIKVVENAEPVGERMRPPQLSRGLTEGDSKILSGDDGPGTGFEPKGATKKSTTKGKKKTKRGKKGGNSSENNAGGEDGHSRRRERQQKELRDECVSAFLEPECLGFPPSQTQPSPREVDNGLLHFEEDLSSQECGGYLMGQRPDSLRRKGGIICGTGRLVDGERQEMECSGSCGVGMHNPSCKVSAMEGVREVHCTCHWIDFPSRRSSDSGLADVCCAGMQGDRRKKEHQQTPPSQRGDDGCHDCEARTISASTSPLSPLVSPLPTEDGVGGDEEAAPWWEKVRLTAQALGVSAEALKLSAQALKVSADAMGFLGDQGAAGRQLAGINASVSGNGRPGGPPPPGAPTTPSS